MCIPDRVFYANLVCTEIEQMLPTSRIVYSLLLEESLVDILMLIAGSAKCRCKVASPEHHLVLVRHVRYALGMRLRESKY